jgi:outer membrane immunogenic protein
MTNTHRVLSERPRAPFELLPGTRLEQRLAELGRTSDRGSVMKQLFLATTAFVLLAAASAQAADMYARPAYTPPPAPAPLYTWTGMYWGANVGYSWGNARYDATLTGVGTISNSERIDGAIGGVQTGYNYQFGAWVWGLETDIQASGEKGGSTLVGVLPLTSVTTDHKLDWFGTTRARLGVLATPNVLFYGTAGVAYGQVKDNVTITVAGASAIATFSDVKAGWTAGGGVEGAFGGGWSAKLEYLYMDLGKTEQTFTGVGFGTIASETRRTTDNIVRVGLNYKWGAGY